MADDMGLMGKVMRALYDNSRSKAGAGWSKFTDMAMGKDDRVASGMPPAIADSDAPEYPYGLRITLTGAELDKLGMDCDCDIGDVIDLRAMGTVTSVSMDKSADGVTRRRVEIQLEKIAVENEAGEMPDDEANEATS